MDDDKQNDPEKPEDKSRKRTPPTIDLKAASVSERASSSNEASPPEPTTTSSSSADPSADTARASWRDRLDSARAFRSLSSASVLPIIVAALSGALAAILVIGAAWLIPSKDGTSRIAAKLPQSGGGVTGKSDMESRLAKIETRVSNAGSAPAALDPAVIARIDAMEKSLTALRDDIKSRGEKTEAAIGELKSAPRETSAAPDLAPLEERLAKIERATIALTGEIAAPPKPTPEDLRLRRIASATMLDATVRQGEPYSVALAAAKSSANNASTLKALDEFAATGIPSANSLSRELAALLPKLMTKTEPAPVASGNILDRLQSSAANLVRIERTDAMPSAIASTLKRASDAAQRDDVATASRELKSLPVAERAPVQAWLDKVDARDAALAASRQFATDAIAALSKPAQ